jgi:hypothetical protein
MRPGLTTIELGLPDISGEAAMLGLRIHRAGIAAIVVTAAFHVPAILWRSEAIIATVALFVRSTK